MDILEESLTQIMFDYPEIFQFLNQNCFEDVENHSETINTRDDINLNTNAIEDSSDLDLDFISNYVDPIIICDNITDNFITQNTSLNETISREDNNIQVGGHLNYNIDIISTRQNQQFNCEEKTYQLSFSQSNSTFPQAIHEIYQIF